MNANRSSRSRAFVLVAVLVVVILSSMVAVSLIFRLRSEELATAAGQASDQAWAAAQSGIQNALHLVANIQPGSLEWQDQPGQLRHQLVCSDGSDQWYFTVFCGSEDPLNPVRYGLDDEAAKLNVLDAGEVMLASFPDLTTPRLHALLDYLDADDTPYPEGAEQEYYNSLPQPYTIRDGPLDTIEELLLVRGFSPGFVFGEDSNFNHRLDPNEDDGDIRFPPDDGSGSLKRGLRQDWTLASYDPNKTDDGYARINFNDPAESYNEVDFPEALVQFIGALRRAKLTMDHPAQLLEAKQTFKNQAGQDVELASGVDTDLLPLVLDQFSAVDRERFPGLLNINTASSRVLQTVPGLEPNLAETIVSARRGVDPDRRKSIAWLYQEKILDAELFKRLAPWLTARSYQFRFQVIGYGLPSGRYQVWEVGIDSASQPPSVSYLRDLTRLGLPFDIRTENNEFDG